MSIRATCPACGKGGNVPDHAAGKAVKCPGCGGKITVPDLPPAAPPITALDAAPNPFDFAAPAAPPLPPARPPAAARPAPQPAAKPVPPAARPAPPAPAPEPLGLDDEPAPARPPAAAPMVGTAAQAAADESAVLKLPRVVLQNRGGLSFGRFKSLSVTDPAAGFAEVGTGKTEKSLFAGWFDNLKPYANTPYVFRDPAAPGAPVLTVLVREPSLLARLPVAVPATRFEVLDPGGRKVGAFAYKPVEGWLTLKSALYLEDANGQRVGEMVWVAGGGAKFPYLELRSADGRPLGQLVDQEWAATAAELAANQAAGQAKRAYVSFSWLGDGKAKGLNVAVDPARVGDRWTHRMLLALGMVVECYGVGKRQAGRERGFGGGHTARRR